MDKFAALLDRLVLTPQRNTKLRLLADYFRSTPDPDRGYALAALTGDLDIPSVKPAIVPVFTTLSSVSPVDLLIIGGKLLKDVVLHWTGLAGTAMEQSYRPRPLMTMESGTGSLPALAGLLYQARTSSCLRWNQSPMSSRASSCTGASEL